MSRLALVIEDDLRVREIVVHDLQRQGFEVTEATTLTEALAAGADFDLVVTDNNFPPREHSFPRPQAERIVREFAGRCPVIVHSGDDLSAQFNGMDGVRVVQKGSPLREFVSAVEELTGEATKL